MGSQFPTQRRRQVEALRPRQSMNNVNTGALGGASSTEDHVDPAPAHGSGRTKRDYLRQCAQLDLI